MKWNYIKKNKHANNKNQKKTKWQSAKMFMDIWNGILISYDRSTLFLTYNKHFI